MNGDDVVKHLIITGVKFTNRQLGPGAYGKVFPVDYNGVTCAAKKMNPILIKAAGAVQRSTIKQNFLRECLLRSKLHHPNTVKMLEYIILFTKLFYQF